jgi:hypothetical protein
VIRRFTHNALILALVLSGAFANAYAQKANGSKVACADKCAETRAAA